MNVFPHDIKSLLKPLFKTSSSNIFCEKRANKHFCLCRFFPISAFTSEFFHWDGQGYCVPIWLYCKTRPMGSSLKQFFPITAVYLYYLQGFQILYVQARPQTDEYIRHFRMGRCHQYFKLPWVRPKPLRSKPAGNCSCVLAWSTASHLVLSELPICSSSSGQVGPTVSSPYSSGLWKMTFPMCLLTLRLQALNRVCRKLKFSGWRWAVHSLGISCLYFNPLLSSKLRNTNVLDCVSGLGAKRH